MRYALLLTFLCAHVSLAQTPHSLEISASSTTSTLVQTFIMPFSLTTQAVQGFKSETIKRAAQEAEVFVQDREANLPVFDAVYEKVREKNPRMTKELLCELLLCPSLEGNEK